MMPIASLTFPHLNPVALRLGPVAIRWYGLAYLLAFITAYLQLRRMIRAGMLKTSYEQLADLIGWLILGVMVGGRGGWWVFYHRAEGAIEPWFEPIAIWHGGMSFHGGLIGVVIALIGWS